MIQFVLTLLRLLRALVYSFKDPEFQALFFLVIVTLLSGTLFYWHVEGGACSTPSTSAPSR